MVLYCRTQWHPMSSMATDPISAPLAYTVPAFCLATGISRRTFYALQKRGEGPPVTKIGRRTLVRREAAETWLKAQEAA